jgi:hypothetical protein
MLLAFSLPFLLSGMIRAVTALSLPFSLILAFIPCFAMVIMLMPWLRSAGLRSSGTWWIEVIGVIPIGFAIWALFHRDFGGFMNLDGWDGGSHVFIKDQFATWANNIYNSQVTYYAFTWWLEKLFHLDSFRSFTIAFYVIVAGVLSFPLAIAFTFVHGEASSNRVALGTGIVVTVLATMGILWLVLLPLFHYNQAAGYYVHLFGLLPMMFAWAVDVLIRKQILRILALLGTLVLLRYTYALNLADMAIAVAILLTMEGFRGRWRIIQGLLVMGLCVAAWLVVSQLQPIFKVWGGMQRFDVDKVLKADLLLLGVILVYVVATSVQALRWDCFRTPLFRVLRFPLFFAATSSVLFCILRTVKGVQYYYVTKYQIWACILLAFALVIVLSHLSLVFVSRCWWRRPGNFIRIVLVGVLLATVPGLWTQSFAGYHETLQERVGAHRPSYRFLRPLVDVEAIARIKTVLSVKHKRFGGYLTAFFPMFSFMNGVLGRHAGYQDFFPAALEPGYCVFWVTRERDIYRLGLAQRMDGQREVAAAAGSTCAEYKVPWKSTLQSLCYHCY